MAERTLLQQARKDRGLKQHEVAEAIGCSINSIGLWEGGGGISDHNRNKLCKFYGKSRAALGLGTFPHQKTNCNAAKYFRKYILRSSSSVRTCETGTGPRGLVKFLAESPSGILAPQQLLSQCTAAIAAGWQLFR